MAYNNSFVESVFPFNHLDDISFSAALYEMSHGPIIFDFDRLDTLVFNPVEHLSSAHSLSSNLDPDLNFYATSPYTCNYMVENEINKLATAKRGVILTSLCCTLTAVVCLAIFMISKH